MHGKDEDLRVSGACSWIAAATSRPFISGMVRSSRTRSGRYLRTCSMVLRTSGGFGNDVEPGLEFENRANAAADDAVIIGNLDAVRANAGHLAGRAVRRLLGWGLRLSLCGHVSLAPCCGCFRIECDRQRHGNPRATAGNAVHAERTVQIEARAPACRRCQRRRESPARVNLGVD